MRYQTPERSLGSRALMTPIRANIVGPLSSATSIRLSIASWPLRGLGHALLIFGFPFPCRKVFLAALPCRAHCVLSVRIAAALVSLNGHMKIRR